MRQYVGTLVWGAVMMVSTSLASADPRPTSGPTVDGELVYRSPIPLIRKLSVGGGGRANPLVWHDMCSPSNASEQYVSMTLAPQRARTTAAITARRLMLEADGVLSERAEMVHAVDAAAIWLIGESTRIKLGYVVRKADTGVSHAGYLSIHARLE